MSTIGKSTETGSRQWFPKTGGRGEWGAFANGYGFFSQECGECSRISDNGWTTLWIY